MGHSTHGVQKEQDPATNRSAEVLIASLVSGMFRIFLVEPGGIYQDGRRLLTGHLVRSAVDVDLPNILCEQLAYIHELVHLAKTASR